ncbi:hypothetical protein GX51_01758 [Blastomyces parvus]|uniref:Uncharacterized protein n=1 Tax=Blastomyces parvus TaxID=2060905 RepID=A0A2B7XFN7_9EURO|nr:hypothetical protein GX51_01758 [Blastomyces parvus]
MDAVALHAFEAISLKLALIGNAELRYKISEVVTFRSFRHTFAHLKCTYGLIGAITLVFIFPDADDVIRRIEEHSAIIAQVAISALSLQSLSSAHWTSLAVFVISLVTALLSVFYACLLHRTLGSLYRTEDVKDWLSKPSRGNELRRLEAEIMRVASIPRDEEQTPRLLGKIHKGPFGNKRKNWLLNSVPEIVGYQPLSTQLL